MNDTSHRTRIKVVQYMFGDHGYFRWSEAINRRYCDRHGYEYVISREEPRPDRHVTWHKIPVIRKELNGCDYLLFLDADAFFYSLEVKLEEELIPLMEGRDVLMAQDVLCESSRPTPGLPNSGVILIRTGEQARRFFQYWDIASDIDISTRWTWPPEQLALWRIVLLRWGDLLKVHPEYYLFQGIYGQYIRHYMEPPSHEREQLMQAFCRKRGIPPPILPRLVEFQQDDKPTTTKGNS